MTNQERAEKIVWHDRFWDKVLKTDTCWIWTAAISANGYGSFCIDGVQRGAHRIAFEIVNGNIAKGLELDHLCRNPPCVRPSHLEAVSHKVNMLRGNNVGADNAKRTNCKCGLPFDYIRKDGGRGCRTCQRKRSKRIYEKNRERILARHRELDRKQCAERIRGMSNE